MTAHWRYLDSLQPLPNLFFQAALRRKTSSTELPDLGLRSWVTVEADKLAAYRSVCNFADSSLLPLTYPHLLAFPLQVQLMAAPDFPFPLLGMVHLANRIRVHRPLGGVHKLYVSVHANNLQPHDKGATFTLSTQIDDALGLLWEEESTFLCKNVTVDGLVSGDFQPSPLPMNEVARWQTPTAIGRQYARVSGDYNPIHLSAPSARLFGFPKAIAHGMWLKARTLAALQSHLPDSNVDIAVQFHKPVRLPGEVILSASTAGSQGQFRVDGQQAGIEHMSGTWQPIAVAD